MPESALGAAARARGATFVEIDGFAVAGDFGDAEAEYRAVRELAGLVDLAFRHRIRATGSDRLTFLQGMLSNDVATLADGQGCAALLLTEQGKVVADLVVLATEDALLLDGFASASTAATAALERFIVADDVELAPLGAADHAFGLYGPGAAAALGKLGAADLPTADFHHVTSRVGDVETRIVRVPAPGAGGYVCIVTTEAAAQWWTCCLDAGISPAGHRAFDVLRIESGVPWYGRDVGADTIALEAPYEDAISFRKGCYLGQEVMERVSARGHVNRKLVGLELTGADVPPAGTRLFADGRDVGWITSACWSWRLRRSIALGYVRREHLAPGTTLALGAVDSSPTATVRALPFV